jgi:hypothetical protein
MTYQSQEEQIKRIVAKYHWNDSKELFRSELEQLVSLTRQEQLKPKNINRLKNLAFSIFDIADTRIYYEGEADGLTGAAKDMLGEFKSMLLEEFGIEIDDLLKEFGVRANDIR